MTSKYELQVSLQLDCASPGWPEAPPGRALVVPPSNPHPQAKSLVIHLRVNNEEATASRGKRLPAIVRCVDRVLGLIRHIASNLAAYTLWW